ncbi:MAG TPA: hypothetical protein PL020_03115 [Candidatus Cloacimonadota bacterium]|nr:hypothetical protein [Candidatus Cloacimonadota bacterium]
MKKLLALTLLLVLVIGLFAQEAKKEALESLDAAKSLINAGDYAKAQEELNYAQAKISEIMAEDLLKHIPEKPQGFTFEGKEASSLGQAGAIIGSANAVAAVGHYTKGNGSYDVTITTGGAVGQTGNILSGFASMFGGMAASTSQVRVKGYTGTMDYDKDNDSGTLTISVGSKITVIIEGEDTKSPDDLKALAEQVDMSLLEKSF